MKHLIVILLAILLFNPSTYAQDTPAQLDLVILKNGTRLYGAIQENIPGETLKMTTEQGSEMTIKYAEIKAVVYDTSLEESEPDSGRKSRKSTTTPKEERPLDLPANRGYFSAGGGLNIANYSDIGTLFPFPSIYAAGGYRIGNHFILAAGLQLITADVDLYLSTFAEAKINFMKTSATPYLSVKSGILFPVLPFHATQTTYNINPSFGIRFPSRKKVHSTMYVGYMYLPYSGTNNNGWNWPGVGEYHIFSIGGGIEF